MTVESRPIHEIAKDIRKDWTKIDPRTNEYLKCLERMDRVNDMVGMEYGDMVVAHFLAFAAPRWRGEVARKIKAELNLVLQQYNLNKFGLDTTSYRG